MSEELGTLTISLFVAGYCVGPLLWGPLSEVYGRRPVFIFAFLVYTIFQVAAAVSTSTAQMLVFRFLGGTFAAAPLTNSGALIADIWDARTRGKALAMFTLAPFAGPALGPTVAGFIAVSGASWRWVFWVLTIFAGVCWLQIVLTLPETYAPALLVQKAKRMRKETGEPRYYAHTERLAKKTLAQTLNSTLARPFRVLFAEPMLMAITVYMSFVYGCLYLLFEAYPIVFTELHGFNAGISGLMFLPLPVGGLIAVVTYIVYFNPRYERAMAQHAPNPVPPEFRLEMAIVAAPFFAISFFWFAWTSSASISFAAPMMAGVLLGFSICWIFLALFNYMIDAYLFVSASALAANTVCRSLAGAAFPLFATQMYTALGPHWASSLVGFIALLLMPIPFVLFKYGPTLRIKSKYAPSAPALPKEPISEV
ncbi:MFS general substrate transporter [Athelia psychrophila]|uniref:MFS general substrate transporter n=1 Tax=Athelia psychrophila TaxID=1759441 RepID=A0A165ZEV8_9AGAM|nr:MFS general substrate transporter [Fibularhizoctonia sp. CBS 109695]